MLVVPGQTFRASPVTEAAGARCLAAARRPHRATDVDDALAALRKLHRRVHDEPGRPTRSGTIVSAVVLAALWFTDPAQIWDTLSAADLRWIAAASSSTWRRYR
jgi:hypothetical protein